MRATIAAVVVSLSLANSALAQRVNISNESLGTRFHLGGRTWISLPSNRKYIQHLHWTRSNAGGRVDLEVRPYNVLYLQSESAESQVFLSEGACSFYQNVGGAIQLHPSNASTRSCSIYTSTSLVVPNGTALFIIVTPEGAATRQGTYVGVLSNSATVTALDSVTISEDNTIDATGVGATVEVEAGQLAFASIDGTVDVLGEFNLREFYVNNSRSRGLGPEDADTAYINQLESEYSQRIYRAVQEETVAAIREQEERNPFDDDELVTIDEIFDQIPNGGEIDPVPQAPPETPPPEPPPEPPQTPQTNGTPPNGTPPNGTPPNGTQRPRLE
ncbi:MAG: hypothetical protein ACFB8W_24420 [Elainellaceae cyanobacterium]